MADPADLRDDLRTYTAALRATVDSIDRLLNAGQTPGAATAANLRRQAGYAATTLTRLNHAEAIHTDGA